MSDRVGPARRILFVCEEAPWASANGSSAYNTAIIRTMHDLFDGIDVLVTGPQPPVAPLDTVLPTGVDQSWYLGATDGRSGGGIAALARRAKSGLRIVLGPLLRNRRRAKFGRWLSQADIAAITRMVRTGTIDTTRYAALLVDTIFRADALEPLAGVPPILVAHDVFFKRAKSFARNGYTVATQIDEPKETALWTRFAGIVAINERDRALIAARVGDKAITIYPVASPVIETARSDAGGSDILFLGSGAYHNIDGLTWFLSTLWPGIHAQYPHTCLHVVGTIDSRLTARPDGVTFHGRVDDPAAIATQCSFAISPLRMGSGIKVKMIDYFTLGLPCVATRVAAEGFPTEPSPPFLETEADSTFAAGICRWLADRTARDQHAADIPAYLNQFSHERAVAETRRLLTQISE